MNPFNFVFQDPVTYSYYINTKKNITNKAGYTPDEGAAFIQGISDFYNGITRPLTSDEQAQEYELQGMVNDLISADTSLTSQDRTPSTTLLPATNIIPPTPGLDAFNPLKNISDFFDQNKTLIISVSILAVIGMGFYLYKKVNKNG